MALAWNMMLFPVALSLIIAELMVVQKSPSLAAPTVLFPSRLM